MFLLTTTSKKKASQFISHMGLNFDKASIYQNSTVFCVKQRNQELSTLAKDKRIIPFLTNQQVQNSHFVPWGENDSEVLIAWS